jgi:hypothetical protein
MNVYISKDFRFIKTYVATINNIIIDEIFHKDKTYNISFGLPHNRNDEIITFENITKIILFSEKVEKDFETIFVLKFTESFENKIIYFYESTKNKTSDITFITQGLIDENIYCISCCIMFMFGNIIHSTWKHLKDFEDISKLLKYSDWCNRYNIFYQTYTTIKGLESVETKWTIKVRGDELYTDWQIFIETMKSNSDKLICNNVYFYYGRKNKYHISDHIIGGFTDRITNMFNKTLLNLKSGNIPEFLKHPEQILAYSYLSTLYPSDNLKSEEKVSRIYLLKHFLVVPINTFSYFTITSKHKGNKIRVTPSNYKDFKFITPIEIIEQI